MLTKSRERFRFCANKSCVQPFKVGRGSSRFCRKCTQERARKRREDRKARRQQLGKYPKGFARQQMELDRESQCAICFINSADHLKKHGCELHIHHVILAKVAQQFGDPHAKFNQVPLCVEDHAKMRVADECLLQNDWMQWVHASRAAGLPDQYLKDALDGYGVGWGRLPL